MIRSLVIRPSTPALDALRSAVETRLSSMSLERLHELCYYEPFTRETDQSTILHDAFYDFVIHTDAWKKSYQQFVYGVVRPMFPETFVYQTIPTFRVQLPGNVSVGEFHKDSTYGHSTEAINIWVPLTNAVNTATLWLEDGRGCQQPVNAELGEIVVFDGANVVHGNRTNKEGYTRVSFDMRIIPMSYYRETDQMSINTKKRLVLGDYFSACIA